MIVPCKHFKLLVFTIIYKISYPNKLSQLLQNTPTLYKYCSKISGSAFAPTQLRMSWYSDGSIDQNQSLLGKMILEMIVVCLLILLTLGYHRFVIKPKQMMSFYRKVFEGAGFKVYQYPLATLQAAQFLQYQVDERKHYDCFQTQKEVTSNFDVVLSNLADRALIQFVAPALMQAYHQVDHQRHYRKFELVIGGLRRMVGNGITFSRGEQWKMKRRITTKMLNFTYIRSLVPRIYKITRDNIDEMLAQAQANEKGFYEVDILELTTKIASTVILQLFFAGGQTKVDDLRIKGETFNHHLRKLLLLLEQQLINPLTIALGDKYTNLGLTQLDRDVNSLLADFHEFTGRFVSKRLEELKLKYQNSKEYPEVYTDLIEAFYVEQLLKQEKEVTPHFIQSLVDDFATLYTAGSDTTSHNSLMSIYYTYLHPETQKQVQEEVKKHIPNFTELTYQSFKNCTLLEATLTETLRAYSSANGIFHREAKEDHLLSLANGQKIPIKKGTLLMTQTIPTHYKSSIYPDPQRFDPHRFIDKEGGFVHPEAFTWMNFSAGARNCIGKQLAWTQMKIILSTMVNFYDIQVVEKEKRMVFKEFAANIEGTKFYVKAKKN